MEFLKKNQKVIIIAGIVIVIAVVLGIFVFPEWFGGTGSGSNNSGDASIEQIEPEFSSTTGAATMVLLYDDNQAPVRGLTVYLAEILPLQSDLPEYQNAYVPALDRATAPSAESSQQGAVTFSNVEPRKYALTVMGPFGPILVKDPKTGSEIFVEITAGEVTELGTLVVSLPREQLEP